MLDPASFMHIKGAFFYPPLPQTAGGMCWGGGGGNLKTSYRPPPFMNSPKNRRNLMRKIREEFFRREVEIIANSPCVRVTTRALYGSVLPRESLNWRCLISLPTSLPSSHSSPCYQHTFFLKANHTTCLEVSQVSLLSPWAMQMCLFLSKLLVKSHSTFTGTNYNTETIKAQKVQRGHLNVLFTRFYVNISIIWYLILSGYIATPHITVYSLYGNDTLCEIIWI